MAAQLALPYASLLFAMGIAATDLLAHFYLSQQKLKWEIRVLYLEIILLALVGFMPVQLNFLANALVSFSCAMQVQTFRKVREIPTPARCVLAI